MNFGKCSIAVAFILAASLIFVGCGQSQTSPLVTALEFASALAESSGPAISAASPTAGQVVALIPPAITAALDIIEGQSPVSTAGAVAGQLSTIVAQGSGAMASLSPTNKSLMQGLIAAVQAAITVYEQTYPPATTAQAQAVFRSAYARGFVDSPNPKTAKLTKLKAKDRAAIARARAHLAKAKANIEAALKGLK